MAAETPQRVASNAINTLVIPTRVLAVVPEIGGGPAHLPFDNPCLRIELPVAPDARAVVWLQGKRLAPRDTDVRANRLFFACPPLATPVVAGRVFFRTDGEDHLYAFVVRRAETMPATLESLSTQFRSMTEFSDASPDDAMVHEDARAIQNRLVNAMESMTLSPEDYECLVSAAPELPYTEVPGA